MESINKSINYEINQPKQSSINHQSTPHMCKRASTSTYAHTILCAGAVAFSAEHVLLYGELASGAVVEVLEADAQLVHRVASFARTVTRTTTAWTTSAASTEEYVEYVERIEASSTLSARLQTLLALLVVQLPLLRVRQHLVRLRYLLELLITMAQRSMD